MDVCVGSDQGKLSIKIYSRQNPTRQGTLEFAVMREMLDMVDHIHSVIDYFILVSFLFVLVMS